MSTTTRELFASQIHVHSSLLSTSRSSSTVSILFLLSMILLSFNYLHRKTSINSMTTCAVTILQASLEMLITCLQAIYNNIMSIDLNNKCP